MGRAKDFKHSKWSNRKKFDIRWCKLGVSSRGLGSLESKGDAQYVKGDFQRNADIKKRPKCLKSLVEGIYEGVEWVMENGILKAVELEAMQTELRNAQSKKLEETKLNLWKRFVESL